MHDNEVISYEVNLREKSVTVHTTDDVKNSRYDLIFTDVLLHFFQDEFFGSVILDVNKYDIEDFINDCELMNCDIQKSFQLMEFIEKVKFLPML